MLEWAYFIDSDKGRPNTFLAVRKMSYIGGKEWTVFCFTAIAKVVISLLIRVGNCDFFPPCPDKRLLGGREDAFKGRHRRESELEWYFVCVCLEERSKRRVDIS